MCWEISTLAKTPYGALTVRDMSVSIAAGNRLELGIMAPPGLAKVIALCWSEDPNRRPRFADLVHQLGAIRGAVAVRPEATMVLDAFGELVQRGGGRRHSSIGSGDRPTKVSSENSFAAGAGKTPLALAKDGYVEDGFDAKHKLASADGYEGYLPPAVVGRVPYDLASPGAAAARAGNVVVNPAFHSAAGSAGTENDRGSPLLPLSQSGYVEDGYHSAGACNTPLALAKDGYVEDGVDAKHKLASADGYEGYLPPPSMNADADSRRSGDGAAAGSAAGGAPCQQTLPDDGDGYEEVPDALAVHAATSISEAVRSSIRVGTAGDDDGDGDGYEVLPESLAVNVPVDVESAASAPQRARALSVARHPEEVQAMKVLDDDESRL